MNVWHITFILYNSLKTPLNFNINKQISILFMTIEKIYLNNKIPNNNYITEKTQFPIAYYFTFSIGCQSFT